jgi:plastocyanin
MVYPAARAANAPRLTGPFRVVQKDMVFKPFMTIVPVGAEVSFPNLDVYRHHVYSISPAHPFELKLFGKDENRSVRFDKAGVIAVGCNIHDQMSAFIRVVDTPYAVKTDASGQAVIKDLPNGLTRVVIWHPYMKAPKQELEQTVVLPRNSGLAFTVQMRPPPDMHAY